MTGKFATVKLDSPDVATVILGQSPSSSTYNKVGEGLPFFQGKADFGSLHPVPRVWCNAGQKFAVAGDVLISVRAPVGDVNVATDDCVIGRGITAIRAGKSSDPWFLYFALLHIKPILESRATGSTFASVNKATLLDIDIPFPSRPVQAKIGAFLHWLSCQIEQEKKAFSTAQDLKRATMQKLFTCGLRDEPQKQTEIGMVPESWEVAPLGDYFEIVQGLSLRGNLATDGTGIPFLRTSNVYWGRIDLSNISRMDVETTAMRDLQYDDLLVCEGGEIGRAAVWSNEIENCTYQNHVYRLRPTVKGKINPKFAMRWLEEGFCHRRVYEGTGNKTTIPNLSRSRLSELKMPIATLDEQNEIVTILDTIDRKINLHQEKRAVLADLFKTLLHQLMTGKILTTDLELSEITRSPKSS